MSGSTTDLDLISSSQAGKEVTANALFDAAAPASIFGRRLSTTSGLTWGYYGGAFISAGVITHIGNGTVVLTVSSTNYISASAAGVVSTNTTGFPTGNIPLYQVVTDSSSVTSYLDKRITAQMGGFVTAIPIGFVQQTKTYASTLVIDVSGAATFDVTLTGNIVIGLTNPAYDGQKIVLRIKQDATGSRLVTFDTSIKVGTDITGFTATTTAAKTDILGFIYNAQSEKFDFVAITKGY